LSRLQAKREHLKRFKLRLPSAAVEFWAEQIVVVAELTAKDISTLESNTERDEDPQPSELEQIIFFHCLDVYHKSPDFGELQYE